MSLPNIIVFRNLNSASLQFDNLSVPGGVLASSASVTASDYNQEWEVQSDQQIKDYILAGYMDVGNGNQFFTQSGSLSYVSTLLSKFPFDNDNLGEGQVLYVSGGYIRGTSSGSFIEVAANIGNGEGVFSNKSGQTLNFRSLTASGSVILVSGSDTINISGTAPTGAFNTGSGEGVFLERRDTNFVFRSLTGSGIVSVASGANGTIVISASANANTTGLNTGSGEGIFKEQQGNTLVFRSILGSGSVSIISGTNEVTVSGTTFVQYVSPAPSLHRSIPVYSGTTGREILSSSATIDVSGNIDNVQGTFNGIRYYNKGASDPISPPPADGDRYYNTAMHLEMVYDGLRGKWLSNESFLFPWGRNGNTAVGAFFQGQDGIQFTTTKGFVPPFSGTVVAVGYSRQDTDAAVFEITVTGSQIAFISSSASSGTSYATNANFPANVVLGARNQSVSGSTATDVQGWARLRWRA